MKQLLLLCVLLIPACAATTTTTTSLYQELGGQQKVAEIVDNFIIEIEYNPIIFEYFKDSDIDRFQAKLTEHLCSLTGGPCEYTGDTMVQVHTGMDMTEQNFNLGVDLLINAMDKASIPHTTQNRLLKILAPLRKEMIYL